MGTIHQVITADESKAIQAWRKMDAEQKKVIDRFRTAKQESKGLDESVGKVAGTMKNLMGVLMGGAGLVGALTLAKSAFRDILTQTERITANVSQASMEMAAFAMMQKPGEAGAATRAAAQLGAQYGVKAGPAWFAVQSMQAKTGTLEGGMQAAEAMFALSQRAGVPMEGARQAVAVGMGLNLTPEQAARAAYAAGKASQLSPAQLAEMAGTGLPAYQGVGGGPIAGYGVAAALSGLISDPGLLGTYTRQVGVLLQQRTGKPGKLWKGLGFERPGAEPEAQLRALEAAGITTMGDLQAAGFAKKESLGLSILLANLPSALKTMETVRGYYGQEGLIRREREAAEKDVPELSLDRQIEEVFAKTQLTRTIGPRAQTAQRLQLRRAQLGGRISEYGGDFWPFMTGEEGKRQATLMSLLFFGGGAGGMDMPQTVPTDTFSPGGVTGAAGPMANPARLGRELGKGVRDELGPGFDSRTAGCE